MRKLRFCRSLGTFFFNRDLQKATYDFSTTIGQGAFGPVYKAQLGNGKTVAVKVLATNSRQGAMEFLTEVLLLGRLHHKNLVNLVGYSAERGHHMLVYAYMSNGSLEYLHYGAVPPVVHRDIKSSNILLDQSMKARIADFGLSRQEVINSHSSNVRGTLGYVDPEYMFTRTFTKKSDVYSFGVLLFELISGRNPLRGLMEYVELAAINVDGSFGWTEIADSRLGGKFGDQEFSTIAGLAYRCVSPVSRKRPSMRDIALVLSQIRRPRNNRDSFRVNFTAISKESSFELDLQGIVNSSLTER